MKKPVMNIDAYVEVISRQNLNVEGIIVLQHGRKIAGYRWIPETPRPVYSVSKSFFAAAGFLEKPTACPGGLDRWSYPGSDYYQR
jgi:hypothetical protein